MVGPTHRVITRDVLVYDVRDYLSSMVSLMCSNVIKYVRGITGLQMSRVVVHIT